MAVVLWAMLEEKDSPASSSPETAFTIVRVLVRAE